MVWSRKKKGSGFQIGPFKINFIILNYLKRFGICSFFEISMKFKFSAPVTYKNGENPFLKKNEFAMGIIWNWLIETDCTALFNPLNSFWSIYHPSFGVWILYENGSKRTKLNQTRHVDLKRVTTHGLIAREFRKLSSIDYDE